MAGSPGLTRRRLVAAAGGAALAAEPGPASAGPTLVASQFGAVGDGSADDTGAIQAALDAAFGAAPGTLLIPPGTYRITRTIRVLMSAGMRGRSGVSARGAHFYSAIEDGGNVFEFVNRAETRLVLIEGLDILGSRRDGHGIYIESRTQPFANFCVRDVVVQYCGGDGAHFVGNVSEGQVTNSYFRNNRGNGLTFSNGLPGGTVFAVHVFGCIFGENRRFGAALVNQCNDVAFHGCYFLTSGSYGLAADNGCTLLSNCGFENNCQDVASFTSDNAGVYLRNFGTMVACMGYSMLKQAWLVRGELDGQLVMIGCSGFGSADAKEAGLARLAGGVAATATVIGCSGAVTCDDGFEAVEIGGPGAGLKFGADWRSPALPRLGDYRLWIDAHGRLRLKKGVPSSDEDGAIVGT